MDLEATFTDGAQLTAFLPELGATGPFFFSWADDGEEFDPAVHAQWDDDILNFTIEHQEGDFASLTLQIENPRIGLLAPGRKRWAFLSWFDGSKIVPLFYGRVVGVPDNIQDEVVEISFVAKPVDYDEQKQAIAEAAKVRPYWDPVFFAPEDQDNPDLILEARSQLWHIDRVTHIVSLSNIINAEDGVLSFGESIVPRDSVNIGYKQNPVRKVRVIASAQWDQAIGGTINITKRISDGFGEPFGVIRTRNGRALIENWPKTGDGAGNGWVWAQSTMNVLTGLIDPAIIGLGTPDNTAYLDGGFDTSLGNFGVGGGIGWAYHVAIPMIEAKFTSILTVSGKRRKQENLTIELNSDVQDTLSEPDDNSVLEMKINTSEMVAQGAIPANGRAFFSTARGAQAIEFLIAVARANLLMRSRAVECSFEIPFPLAVAVDVTLRKNVVLEDSRLPGGTATGKIIAYRLQMQDGKPICQITMGSTIGKGGTVTAVEGEPDYVEAAYTGQGYQQYIGQYLLPFPSDIAYETIEGAAVNDDGLTTPNGSIDPQKAVKQVTVSGNFKGTQQDAIDMYDIVVDDTGALVKSDTGTYPIVHLKLIDPNSGPWVTEYAVNVTDLKIPKLIDLEAAA